MRDSVVLDSSVIVAVFFPEKRTERVMEMLEEKRLRRMKKPQPYSG